MKTTFSFLTMNNVSVAGQHRYVSNDGHALRAAALEVAGLLLQPKVLLAEDIASGKLTPVLESFIPKPRAVHLAYLPDFRQRAKRMA